jgi:hypothetical protein
MQQPLVADCPCNTSVSPASHRASQLINMALLRSGCCSTCSCSINGSCFSCFQGKPAFQHGTTDDRPVLPVAPEIFVLRKLLPASDEYDFNIHVMDFEPGQYLYVKEIHYNQHGLLLLQGQGIYRLGNNWCVLVHARCSCGTLPVMTAGNVHAMLGEQMHV